MMYLTKPFFTQAIGVLDMRCPVFSSACRQPILDGAYTESEGLVLDTGVAPGRFGAMNQVVDIGRTPTEFRLLPLSLCTHPDAVYSREQLLDACLGTYQCMAEGPNRRRTYSPVYAKLLEVPWP